MNRLKVWVFALLAAAVAAFLLRAHSGALRADALGRLDARLAVGAAHARSALASAALEAAAIAALAARDPDLARALAPAPSSLEAAAARRPRGAPASAPDPGASDAGTERVASAAVAAAASALGLPGLPEGTQVAAGDRAALERRVAAAPLGPAALRLQAALDGAAPPGFVRAGPALHAAASAPAAAGTAVAVLVPIADGFARGVAAATRLDVTLAAPEARVVSTGRPAEVPALVEAARGGAGEPVGVGALGAVTVAVPPLTVRGLPPLFRAPAHRAIAVPLPGVEGGLVVLSAPTAPALASVAVFEWRALAALALLLVLGLLFGLLVRPSEILPSVPEALLQAAARIERGEFDARAPQLAGKLGTVAEALNRAATAASAAPARGALAPDPFAAAAAAPPPSVEPSAFEFPTRPPRAEPVPPADGAQLMGGAFEAAPVPARPEPPPASPPPARPAAAVAAAAAPLDEALERPAPADPSTDEEGHWREIFQDFLRVRAECGEPAQGLPYERFRQKLQANKATLVAKYGCRTVRFQVYVKEGKTALKATPVR